MADRTEIDNLIQIKTRQTNRIPKKKKKNQLTFGGDIVDVVSTFHATFFETLLGELCEGWIDGFLIRQHDHRDVKRIKAVSSDEANIPVEVIHNEPLRM